MKCWLDFHPEKVGNNFIKYKEITLGNVYLSNDFHKVLVV